MNLVCAACNDTELIATTKTFRFGLSFLNNLVKKERERERERESISAPHVVNVPRTTPWRVPQISRRYDVEQLRR